jgi:hypothetical protein
LTEREPGTVGLPERELQAGGRADRIRIRSCGSLTNGTRAGRQIAGTHSRTNSPNNRPADCRRRAIPARARDDRPNSRTDSGATRLGRPNRRKYR